MAKNKKYIIPDFAKNFDLSKCVPGEVYNIYKCGKCIINHELDKKLRKLRPKIRIQPKDYTKQCWGAFACKHNTQILSKYKKCYCGEEIWGLKIFKTKMCSACNPGTNKSKNKKKKYYRIKLFCFKSHINLNDPNKWDCIFRGYCLESTFTNGSKKGLACKECPFYTGIKL